MSVATDSAMSGGNAAPGNDSGLEQPTDAVQMKNIPQTSEADEKPSGETTTDVAKDTAAVATEPAVPVSIEHDETPAVASSSKGKQVDDAPEPEANPEVLKEEENNKEDTTQQEIPKQETPKEQDITPKDVSPKEESHKEEKPKEDKQEESAMAIGPAEEEIKPAGSGAEGGSVCNITLLLASGGRHPYKIDAKYLSRRHVAMPDEDASGNPDPFSISIYTLKELILREWRSDWEAKPASPSSIRLIHFGKLLDDKEQLKSTYSQFSPSIALISIFYMFPPCNSLTTVLAPLLTSATEYQFSPDSPNVVHMSIRPQDLDEEEPKSGSKSLPAGAADGDGAREGRCCVIL
ncbi:ubiquitin [Trichoderma arundinaceum]|uniref:Ubiquitin n=1 Tax=Trichoderma arundinaceum TaxID=490622 RepID=A0A395NFB2_TRIAR|nr:ubiquitin [Trichoderma arundinaceum]